MPFVAFDYRGKPAIRWESQLSWQTSVGLRGWIQLDELFVILLPPQNPNKRSDEWNAIRIDPACNSSLNDGEIIDLIQNQLRLFPHTDPDRMPTADQIQLHLYYDPRINVWTPRVFCLADGIIGLRPRLNGSVIATGAGDPPSN